MPDVMTTKKPRKPRAVKPAPLWLLFDTETTGLIKNGLVPLDRQPQIIEYYGMLVDEAGVKQDEIELLIDNGKPLEPIITKITGLTERDLRGKPRFAEVVQQIETFNCRAATAVAHNLSYDVGVLTFEYKRLDRDFAFPMSRLCTVEATEHLKGHRLSLSKLHIELFGQDFPSAHRARHDVEALQRCFVELKKRDII